MSKDNVFTYEPKMKANLDLIADIMRCDCDYVVYKDKQLADLEAKLAESEKKHLLDEKEWQNYCAYKYIEPQIKGCLDREWQYEKKIDQLKQQLAELQQCGLRESSKHNLEMQNAQVCIKELEEQLAEKDKEIEELKQRLKDTIKIYSDDFVEKDKELKELRFKSRNIFPLVENLEEKIYQDKIEFAIDELEKVNGILTDTIIEVTQDEFDLNKLCYLEEISAKFGEKIVQQIKELKGNK